MSWAIQGTKLVGVTEEQYDVYPHEFWYVIPARTHYSPHDGKRVRPLEFAFVLHNAALGKGLLVLRW
jgi:mannose-6-phosphate isomerase-like protein (cupin superfamily)